MISQWHHWDRRFLQNYSTLTIKIANLPLSSFLKQYEIANKIFYVRKILVRALDKKCFTIISLKLISKLENQPAEVFRKVVCLKQRWFPEDTTNFLRTAILKNICERLLRRRQFNYLLYGQSGELCRVSRSVGKIIIILSFRVGISKNKNIDHRVKETCAIVSTQTTSTSLYSWFNNVKCTKFLFFSVFHCILKNHIRRYVKSVLLLFWPSKI